MKFEVDIEKVTGVETVVSEDVDVQLQQIIVESATKRLVFSSGATEIIYSSCESIDNHITVGNSNKKQQ